MYLVEIFDTAISWEEVCFAQAMDQKMDGAQASAPPSKFRPVIAGDGDYGEVRLGILPA
ncbi:hypothetical protein [Agrobacterium vitis]|uniref:hypothetical protein n=1 Tax=Agrobacterium vitis TaxID=373 RepID=UPI001574CB43|nr:hypothetical protein [Agrobacterium vitis]NSZ17309.1 hypothetical protein [Agrobacterium vitis]QZO03020.1 hypothetical protein K4831_11225 [Agrobacterium vitis]UJL88144.1 hypothetical protein AVF2S5_09565 [Agrobacterium vitis]